MELPDAIERIRPAVVQIRVGERATPGELGPPPVDEPLGSGFFVSDAAHVITAKHVVDGAEGQGVYGKTHLVVALAQQNTEKRRAKFAYVPAAIVDDDDAHDLALLQLIANPFAGEVYPPLHVQDVPLLPSTTQLDAGRPRDGESVAVSGYPLGEPVLLTNAGFIASAWSFRSRRSPVEALVGVPAAQLEDWYVADLHVNPGNSGGPVYAVRDGAVIGVCVAAKGSPVWYEDERGNTHDATLADRPLMQLARLTMVVPTRYVVELLDRNGVQYAHREAAPEVAETPGDGARAAGPKA